MMDPFTTTAKRCCRREHALLVRKLGACEMESNSADERHACYRRTAQSSGARAKACMAEVNR